LGLHDRLSRLERGAGRRCPSCPPPAVVDLSWYDGPAEAAEPPPCAECGRPADVLRVVEDPDFYRPGSGPQDARLRA
jgi:hypothetical protein